MKDRSHSTTVEGMNMKELAKEVSELRYDALLDFFKSLRLELQKDVVEDASRGRVLLSSHLSNAAGHLCSVENSIEHCWNIAKPHEEGKK